ncbi:MAG: GNAT family N-acetyltransferase [Saprospiraceae bacterium]
MKTLHTERLILDTLRLRDASFFLRLVNTPSWLRYIGDRNVHTRAEAADYLTNGPMRHYLDFGFGMRRMVFRHTREVIGICGLVRRAGLAYPDLGFALLPEYEGQGLAYEASRSILVEDAAAMPRVSAITDADNARSIALLHRLGFREEGTIQLPDQPDVLQYFLLDSAGR